MKFTETIQAQPRPIVVVEALLLVAVIGFFDYISTWEVSLFVFYALPILLLVWRGNRRSAVLLAIGCAGVWWAANLSTNPYKTSRAYIWASINRLAYFVAVAVGGSAMRMQGEAMRARVEALERTRELEQEIVRVSEREQIRIGQDLHDGLCQHLAAIGCAAACLQEDLAEKSLPEATAASFIQEQLNEAVVEARDLARGIFPVQMDNEGLIAALDELVRTTNRIRPFSTQFEFHGEVKIEDPQVGMHLYRIAQEALNNSAKHSSASKVVIRLSRHEDLLTMTITDNGKGFRISDPPSEGMGLRTMRYRARSLGGSLEIETNPSGGTLVRCSIPAHGTEAFVPINGTAT